jgi:hypothetical protein
LFTAPEKRAVLSITTIAALCILLFAIRFAYPTSPTEPQPTLTVYNGWVIFTTPRGYDGAAPLYTAAKPGQTQIQYLINTNLDELKAQIDKER